MSLEEYKVARLALGVTQAELAERLGMEKTTYYRIAARDCFGDTMPIGLHFGSKQAAQEWIAANRAQAVATAESSLGRDTIEGFDIEEVVIA